MKRLAVLALILAATCLMPPMRASAATATVTATVSIRQPEPSTAAGVNTGGSNLHFYGLLLMQAVIAVGYGSRLALAFMASWLRLYNPVTITYAA